MATEVGDPKLQVSARSWTVYLGEINPAPQGSPDSAPLTNISWGSFYQRVLLQSRWGWAAGKGVEANILVRGPPMEICLKSQRVLYLPTPPEVGAAFQNNVVHSEKKRGVVISLLGLP